MQDLPAVLLEPVLALEELLGQKSYMEHLIMTSLC